MRDHRTLVIACLLLISLGTIGAVLADWVRQTGPSFGSGNSPAENLIFLFIIASGIFLGAFAALYVLIRVALFAERHGHKRPLQILARFAPRFTHRVLGSALGTALALTAPTLAHATNQDSASYQDSLLGIPNALPASQDQASVTSGLELPMPGWIPETLNIPVSRLITSDGQRQEKTQNSHQLIVQSGQTLWSITNDLLGADATAAQIAELWPQIYELNKQAIGTNPNLLQLGMELQLPTHLEGKVK